VLRRALINSDHVDEGFTIVEVVISAFILFVVITAVLSLMLSNTAAANQAKEKSVVVNAVASYIEQVRAMPYNDIGMPLGDPPGQLAATSTVVGSFTIDIVPTVTWVDDPSIDGTKDYKLLNIATTATPARLAGSVVTMSTQAIISPAGAGNNVVRVPPSIAWSGSSPATDSIVYGTARQVGGSADAVGTGVVVTNMNLYCDGSLLQNWSGGAAQFTFTTASASCDFYWNSQAKDASNTPFWEDGVRTLKLEAWDSNGQQNYITRSVLVDNHAPIEPASVTVTDTTAATTLTHVITWPVCADGTSPAYRYSIAIYRQPTTSTSTGSYADWTSVPALSASSNNVTRNPQQSFGRYLYAVDSVSVRGLTLSNPATVIAVTRPTITGSRNLWDNGNSGANKKWSLTSSVVLGAPNFPYDTSTVRNTLYHATSASGPWTQVGSPTSAFTLPGDAFTLSSTLTSYYYRVETVITPRGYGGGTPVTLLSNVIGPTGTVAGSGPMTNVGW
jgi:Tfp pilus assembly protein PilV